MEVKILHQHSRLARRVRLCSLLGVFLSNTITITLGIYNYDVSRQVKYEGCMKKTDYSKDFNKAVTLHGGDKGSHIDVFMCVKECWQLRNKVAALQMGYECYCARSEISVIHVPEDECNRRCRGNCYQTCGGINVLSVYQTGYVPEKPFEIDKNVLLRAKIGCYDALSSRPILCNHRLAPLTTARMTVPMCIFYCDSVHQALFATLSAPDSCCCTNSITGARNGVLEWCNIPCSGSQAIGCVGNMLNKPRMATFQLSRLPTFRRWPKETFTMADWLEPIFPAGETFTNVKQKLIREAEDASLSGLMARKMLRQPGESGARYGGMVGQDKREPAHEGVENSVAVLDVPKMQAEVDEDRSNAIIIAAVVIGFAIFTAAFGFYIFSKRKVIEGKNHNANAKVRRRRRMKKRQIKLSTRTRFDNSVERNAV